MPCVLPMTGGQSLFETGQTSRRKEKRLVFQWVEKDFQWVEELGRTMGKRLGSRGRERGGMLVFQL